MGLISDRQVTDFAAWLRRKGRSEGTIALYRKNLRKCGEGKDLTDRLLSKDLAPKTKRTNHAALKAWAKYTKDAELAEQLSEIRLPPAHRVAAKYPLDPAVWKQFMEHVRTVRMNGPTRATILIMANRGLRVSDVLRIKRAAIATALHTGKLAYEGKGGKRIEISARPIKEPLEMLANSTGEWQTVADLFKTRPHIAAHRVRRAVARCGAALKVDGVHPHQLRRTYALAFLKAHDGDAQAMMKLVAHMGWSGISVASTYVDAVNTDELDETGAEMMDRVKR